MYAISAANTVGSALTMLRKTAWFMKQTIAVKRRAEQAVRSLTQTLTPTGPPVAMGITTKNTGARYRGGTSTGSIVLKHTEFVEELKTHGTAGNFNLQGWALNPSRKDVFKWAAQISRSFEKFKIRKCKLRFVPVVATTTKGRVMLGVDYDARDAYPRDKEEAYAMQGTVSGPVWQELVLDVKPMTEALFTTSGTESTSTYETRLVDYGNAFGATSDCTDTSTVMGEVFCDYEIELLIPQRYYETGARVLANYSASTNGAEDGGTILGDIRLSFISNGIRFQEYGKFLVAFYAGSGGATLTFGGTATTSGLAQVTNGSSNTAGYVFVTVTPDKRDLTFTWSASATGTNEIYISRYNG
jgi:hypothetical protein